MHSFSYFELSLLYTNLLKKVIFPVIWKHIFTHLKTETLRECKNPSVPSVDELYKFVFTRLIFILQMVFLFGSATTLIPRY